MMKEKSLTRLAILQTMGGLHKEPLRYDIARLKKMVIDLSPDLLCADVTRAAWENGDLSLSSLEIQEALAPACDLTDTVFVPVAPDDQEFGTFQAKSGWRSKFSRTFDRLLRWGQRTANSPEALHGMTFQLFCHSICAMDEITWKKDDLVAYHSRTQALADNIIRAIQRDPGGRVLVVVQCQWHHRLEPLLKEKVDWLKIVDYLAL
jgi:hypothetical protein